MSHTGRVKPTSDPPARPLRPSELWKRIGRFELPFEMLKCNPTRAEEILDAVLVIAARPDREKQRTVYLGLSRMFDPVPRGRKFLHYRVRVSARGEVEFIRKDEA